MLNEVSDHDDSYNESVLVTTTVRRRFYIDGTIFCMGADHIYVIFNLRGLNIAFPIAPLSEQFLRGAVICSKTPTH